MNYALVYLWIVLLKRRTLHFIRGLRRPTTLIGFAALAFCFGFWFYHRRHEFFTHLVRPEVLIGGALVMLGGSVFQGFLQRGLVFEPPDVEFLFTSPFTQRQIVLYRLLPGYLFALVQGMIFFALFAPHLKHPLMTAGGVMLFQIACFHVSAGAAIFAGTISEAAHHRIRWMMMGAFFLITALYLRAVLGLKLIPAFVSSGLTQVFFYPAVTLSDVGTAPFLRQWTLRWVENNSLSSFGLWEGIFYLCAFAVAAAMSLWLVLRLRANIFETSLATTTRVAERRLRLQQGRSVGVVEQVQLRSSRLPNARLFCGVGAIIWKNLVVARRSRRSLGLAVAFALIYSGFFIALRWLFHDHMTQGGRLPEREILNFDRIIGGMMCVQVFFLQRALPFDFRRDGNHLVGFRALPISPFGLALAELCVPTVFSVVLQAVGLLALVMVAHFDWTLALLSLLVVPAISLALNGVWNLHYLLAATRRAGGKAESASPVALLMVVALSFLIFYPAGWTALQVGRHTFGRFSEPLAMGVGLAVQYLVDFLLVVILARLFQRFEVSRDAP